MRQEGDPVVLLDGGDVFGDGGLTAWIKATTALEGMSLMRYDAFGLGDHELQFGVEGLDELAAQASFPMFSTNLRQSETGEPHLASSVFLEAGSIRIALLSVIGPSLVPAGLLDDGHGQVLEVVDATEAVQESVAEVRADAELVIVLAHVGLPDATALADVLPDADIVIASHGGPWLSPPLQRSGVVVAASGQRGQYVGRLDLTFDADGTLTGLSGGPVILGPEIPDDPALAALYQDYLAEVESAIEDLLASIPEEVPPTGGSYVGAQACAGCHPSESAQWQTTAHAQAFAPLVAMNQQFDPDCTVCHTTGLGYLGGFRLESETPDMIDVQCESCHGAGADHAASPAPGYGLTSESTCRACHEAARFPDWDYATALPHVLHIAP